MAANSVDLVQGLLVLLAAGPFTGIGVVAVDSRFGGPALTRPRLVKAAMWGGAVCTLPGALIVVVAPEGGPLAILLLAPAVGALYGSLVGVIAALINARRGQSGDRAV